MRNFYEELEEILKNSKLTREQKVQIIKEAGNEYDKQIDNELNNYLAKQYAGAAIEIGSAAIPVGGVAGQIAKRTLPAVVSKTIGRKFTHDIATSAIGGGINSSVYGVGRGLMEDKNPFTTALQDGVTGFSTGAALGGITGKINQAIDKNNIYSFDNFNLLSKSDKKNYINQVNKYYNKYEQGLNPELNNIGIVKLPSQGFKETLKQNPELGKEVINLSNNLKKAEYKGVETPRHDHKYDITQFHRLNHNDIDYLIAQNSKGDNYFHKAVTPDLIAGPKPDGQGLPSNIINHFLQKNNLPEWLNSKAATGITSVIDNYVKGVNSDNIKYNSEEEKPYTLEGRVEKWENSNNININKDKFPVEDIVPNIQQIKDWSGYKNPITGNNRIYTAEDIGDMTTKEFGEREKEIDAQINKMGIPRRKDLSVFGGGTIYIAPYTRADGTQVKGHYRAMR